MYAAVAVPSVGCTDPSVKRHTWSFKVVTISSSVRWRETVEDTWDFSPSPGTYCESCKGALSVIGEGGTGRIPGGPIILRNISARQAM